ncbi:hypothetical protein MPNT_20155 [Candidatus Methylacidithermus pantelleriae]|uniref:Uncharacterized protein n=1 Tax=Candidatus Methylacidithermus pantelleriae TaxID=2744239 RepID=A0A8J2FNJ8_9BACT|nr:hypothetical protein MPNT_20155 [Candidatus Methylacidithermus pantelleriae]
MASPLLRQRLVPFWAWGASCIPGTALEDGFPASAGNVFVTNIFFRFVSVWRVGRTLARRGGQDTVASAWFPGGVSGMSQRGRKGCQELKRIGRYSGCVWG